MEYWNKHRLKRFLQHLHKGVGMNPITSLPNELEHNPVHEPEDGNKIDLYEWWPYEQKIGGEGHE